MPLSTTFGNSSARNYGFKARSLILNTQTFTSSTTFTAPATTTSLLSITGQGGTGSVNPAYWASNPMISQSVFYTSQYNFGGPQWSNAFYWSDVFGSVGLGKLLDGNTADRTYGGGGLDGSNASWNGSIQQNNLGAANLYNFSGRVRGAFYLDEPFGTAPRSGQITYNDLYNLFTNHYWVGTLYVSELYVDESYNTGDSSTGFGKTFVGGTGGAATPATYTNVAVTPGQSYSLTIPSGGSIQISYYS